MEELCIKKDKIEYQQLEPYYKINLVSFNFTFLKCNYNGFLQRNEIDNIHLQMSKNVIRKLLRKFV